MSILETCVDPTVAWQLVSHYLGNVFMAIRLAIESQDENWQADIDDHKKMLVEKLGQISVAMSERNFADDSGKIAELHKMVEKGDLTSLEVLAAIDVKNLEYNEGAREMEAKLRELFRKA